MPSERPPESVWSGKITAAGVTLHCHVLEGGTRIIEKEGFESLLAALDGGAILGLAISDALGRWMQGDDSALESIHED